MLLTLTNRLKLTQAAINILRAACHLSKNLFNVGLYTVRQYFFQERKYLRYEGSYHLCKTNENYQLLATDIGQQTLKIVDRAKSGPLRYRNNQNFVQIPYHILRFKLQSLCERVGIQYTEQEESYTSKASALDGDEVPSYNADNPQTYTFSGKRIKRGLYRTKTGRLINSDANGALNILRKHLNLSKANDYLLIGRCSGCVAQPSRLDLEKPLLYSKG